MGAADDMPDLTLEAPCTRQCRTGQAARMALVVDDSPLVLEFTKILLERTGHCCATALLAERALAQLESGLNPDVILLDLNMPGLGGARALPFLRALRPATPIILMTALFEGQELELTMAHPQVTILPKPFSLQTLQAHLERVYGGRGTSRSEEAPTSS
jgi:CheY-like chemotaxis protein